MPDAPIISVIVPIYKVEAFLDRCVESILAQSYRELEIILVDDGSPDNSGAMCDRWAERDTRIKVVHKQNGGLSSARNAGLDVATGECVMFIDSDDVIHPDMCRILYDNLQKYDARIATCEAAHTHGDEPPFTVIEEQTVLTPIEAIRRMWYQTGFFPSSCTKMYYRDVFENERFTEGLQFEDVDIMHRLLWQAKAVVCTPSALYGYMHRGESITTQTFSVRDLDILKIADGLLRFAQEHEPSLLGAARAYAVTAALRVELNAPKTPVFSEGHAQAHSLLRAYARGVIFDKNTRMKTRCGLLLYYGCRPLMRYCYKRIDRWK